MILSDYIKRIIIEVNEIINEKALETLICRAWLQTVSRGVY